MILSAFLPTRSPAGAPARAKVPKRDFLKLADLSLNELHGLIERARVLKADRAAGISHATLHGRSLGLIFEKASTRTKLSFEAAILQLGGHAITLQSSESQIGRGEPVADTSRVASRYVDVLMYRTFGDDRLHEFARHSKVPVINGLSDGGHPVQLLADLMTVVERHGSLAGRSVAWIGDGASNMALSWIEAASLFGFQLAIAAPEGYRPPAALLDGKPNVRLALSPQDAVHGADVVTTDVWASMGQEKETAARKVAFASYTVDMALLKAARPTAIVLHCLPAHRGEEISADVIDCPQSAIFDEAENRMHVQKALLEKLLLG